MARTFTCSGGLPLREAGVLPSGWMWQSSVGLGAVSVSHRAKAADVVSPAVDRRAGRYLQGVSGGFRGLCPQAALWGAGKHTLLRPFGHRGCHVPAGRLL